MDGSHFLRHHQGVGIVEPGAAEFDRLVQAEKAETPELPEQRMGRNLARRLPFVDMGVDLGGDEFL